MPRKDQGAPWVRTRLRTAPVSAVAFALLVLVTAFLAALLPRAVEAYETDGLREALAGASPESTVLELKAPQPGLEEPDAARADAVLPEALRAVEGSARALLPEPLRADPAESAYGVRTAKSLEALDASLPRPDGLPPRFTVLAQSGAAGHADVREGRMPTAGTSVTVDTRRVEGAVTTQTARVLRLRAGSELTLAGFQDRPLTVRITGVLEPRHPQRSYWSAEPTLRAPALASGNARPPQFYWEAGLLLAPGAAPALLGSQGEPEKYWRFAPATGGLTSGDTTALVEGVASLENGPGLVRMRGAAGPVAQLSTGLEQVVGSYTATRDAITPVVAVAAFGIAAVAVVVLTMSAGVAAARRDTELALLRARGGSLRGISGRLLAETAAPAVPAAACGLLLAVLVVDEARSLPAVLGAGAVALLACAGLPVRAALAHRRPRAHQERDDLAHTRPGRRRTVAELTLLVLAVGSVAALRRRGTSGGSGDLLVSAAPVLVGLVAALVLVRLYPLPLRWAAGPAGRLRGLVGFLSLARAGRSAAAVAALPLLALLTALTTAAFGGSVLAGVADARDRAALLETGADARISTTDGTPLPAGLARAVGEVAGVRQVTAVGIEYAAERETDEAESLPVAGVEPGSYAELARRTGLGGFTADRLGARGGVLDAVASPEVAKRIGRSPHRIVLPGGAVTVRITAVRPRTPAAPEGDFLLVDAAGLKDFGAPSVLLATGSGIDAEALRTAVNGTGAGLSVTLRGEARAALSDSPLQTGAERIYVWAVVAGAGYALLALVLGLLRSAPERAALLARLRTLGLTARQGRRLLGLEALPLALLAAGGGMAVGWATVGLLAPGIDLDRLALPDASGGTAPGGAALRADVWSLALPAAAAVLLAGAVAVAQAWWAGRRTPITHLRAGDMR
ncbi:MULTISPECIES: ABC transporter permease [Streptomyces]|uniref:ABC transporter permease n=1 Tax=Streptomyces koelreuteriae TaxID=2838015 RepID=A0ABX8FYD4_9ACTN|nr:MULTISPECIES: ABC transporter permease [Streptomyces]QWB26245.1 ABC transporter permease [Streptomyces koelreuteriae]UUA09321.1 ABC transporter permease [Streptomyces koelreuteriae]UUA16925.1 ABC transporter permease [Streptomyces sp. CRCS-T-1]